MNILLHKSCDMGDKLHSGICAAFGLIYDCIEVRQDIVSDILEASDPSQCHREPRSVSRHMHMISLPSLDKEHKDLYDMGTDICGSYILASCHKSLSRVGSHHHNSGVYKHGVHSLAFSGTSSHMPNLDNKESLSSSFHTCRT